MVKKGSSSYVKSMREMAQAHLDAHRTRISMEAEERQLLPLLEQRAKIREGLVKYGTDCDANDADPHGDGDQSPIATKEGREFARNLWATGAEFNAMLSGKGFEALSNSCMLGQVKQAEMILKLAASISADDDTGRPSPFLIEAMEARESSLRLSPLLVIVSIGKNINASCFPELRKGQEECARLLLKYGARPDARDCVGKTVVHYGAGKMASETTMKIVDMCIRAHKSCHLFAKKVELFGLSNQAMNGMRGIARGFVEETNRRAVYLFDKMKEVAVRPENIRLIEGASAATAAVEEGASSSPGGQKITPLVDMQDRLGAVALHELVMSNRDDVAKFLLFQHDASYDVAELDAGCTPWSMATINTCMSSVSPVVVEAGVRRGRKEQKEAAKKCRHCGKMESDVDRPIQVCSKCKVTVYCSRECQVAAWKAGHKDECKTLLQDQTDGIRLVGKYGHHVGAQRGGSAVLMNAKSGRTMEAGKYQRPTHGVAVDERFFIKVQYARDGPLLVYDKTRTCCFDIFPHQTGYKELTAKVLAQTATNGLKSYFEASFDAKGVCTIYPGTSTLKKW